MAAGKTSLGRKVAKDLGIPFVDTDAVFVRRHGAIADYFVAHGEPAFRLLEAEIIAEEVARPGPRIVALGGGAVLAQTTRELLRGHPVVLLMTTQAAVLRTANLARRPLLRDDPDAWGRILEERRPLYLEVADVTFRTDRATKEQLARRVAGWMRAQGRKQRDAAPKDHAEPGRTNTTNTTNISQEHDGA
ncbi:MAG: shikimate kinase [Leucobacter sp.]|nr:shikimate kinase [Leucobacter sp.]